MIPETITIPKKALEEVFTAGRRLLAAEDVLENAILASNPEFVKKMRRLKAEHLRGANGARSLSSKGLREYAIFDALRDNQGKGLKADDLLRILDGMNR